MCGARAVSKGMCVNTLCRERARAWGRGFVGGWGLSSLVTHTHLLVHSAEEHCSIGRHSLSVMSLDSCETIPSVGTHMQSNFSFLARSLR